MIEANMEGWPWSYVTEWYLRPQSGIVYKRLVEQPAIDDEPITLDQAKSHLRIGKPGVDHPEDENIKRMIAAARKAAENFCNRVIAVTSLEYKSNDFYMDLAGPLVSISSVKYLDAAGTLATLAATVYEPGADRDKPTLRTKIGQSFPSVYGREDAVTVTFIAGQDRDLVDPALAHGILLILGDMFDHREATLATPGVQPYELPLGVKYLLGPYRMGMGV